MAFIGCYRNKAGIASVGVLGWQLKLSGNGLPPGRGTPILISEVPAAELLVNRFQSFER